MKTQTQEHTKYKLKPVQRTQLDLNWPQATKERKPKHEFI